MSFWRTYYHLVWATYRRQPVITPELECQLFPYLVERATSLGVHVLAINGWTDHVRERHCYIAVEYVERQKEHHAAHQTNVWLERTEDDDVGPRYVDEPASGQGVALREDQAPYGSTEQLDDEFPF